jgi:hypothetical protein
MKTFIMLSILSFNIYGQVLDSNEVICKNKTQKEFEQRIYNLENIKYLDDDFKYSIDGIPFLSLQALDMIKSQTKEKNDKLYWLLELRPLPKNTELESKFYPRVILECKQESHSFTCITSTTHDGINRIIKKLDIDIHYLAYSEKCNSPAIEVDYHLEISKSEYIAMKDEVFTQLSGSSTNMIAKFMDKVFDPKSFFEDYFSQLYKAW